MTASTPGETRETVSVPREPTPEMLEPFARCLCSVMELEPDEPVAPHGEWPQWYDNCAPLAAAYTAMLAAAPPPMGEGEPVAWLIEWDDRNRVHKRVQLSDGCEPWLDLLSPLKTPLYAAPTPLLEGEGSSAEGADTHRGAEGAVPDYRQCKYCGPGVQTGLPGNACENCMGTGLANPEHETAAWAWVQARYPNDAASDLAFDADEMVDAYIAGASASQQAAVSTASQPGTERSGVNQSNPPPPGDSGVREALIGLQIEARPCHEHYVVAVEITPAGADDILQALAQPAPQKGSA